VASFEPLCSCHAAVEVLWRISAQQIPPGGEAYLPKKRPTPTPKKYPATESVSPTLPPGMDPDIIHCAFSYWNRDHFFAGGAAILPNQPAPFPVNVIPFLISTASNTLERSWSALIFVTT